MQAVGNFSASEYLAWFWCILLSQVHYFSTTSYLFIRLCFMSHVLCFSNTFIFTVKDRNAEFTHNQLCLLKKNVYSEGSEALALLPRELCVPHPWRCSELDWMGPWALIWWGAALPMAGGWIWMSSESLPTQAILWFYEKVMYYLLLVLFCVSADFFTVC